MEVVIPAPAPALSTDFNFDSPCSSPYMTAPSSPQRFPNFFFSSAPTSPSHFSPLFCGESSAAAGQENPQLPKNRAFTDNLNDQDFAFEFSKNSDRTSLSAEELFDCGKIRPLNTKNDPGSAPTGDKNSGEFNRGRERISGSPSFNRKKTRSLSPLRVSDIIFQEDSSSSSSSNGKNSNFSAISSVFSFSSKNYRKWKFKDFLLFRSASEGRATRKDPLMKYSILSKKTEDLKNLSFRSFDGDAGSRRTAPVSAHEAHYIENRAVREEMKRKTFLPYKQGLLGCLSFNPGLNEISRGIGSLPRG